MLEVCVLTRFWAKRVTFQRRVQETVLFQSSGALKQFYFAGFLFVLELTSLVGYHWLCWLTETKVTSGKEAWNVVSPGNSSIQGHRCVEGGEASTP